MRPMAFTTTALAAADTDSISLSQTPLGAGNLTITGALAAGGVATLTAATARPRYGLLVTVKCAGADAARTFTITGTRPGGSTQTETIAGANAGTTTGALYFETVTQVAVDAATAGAIEIGTAQAGGTDWMPMDVAVPNQATTFSAVVTGTINYSVQYTNEDPFDRTITQLAKAHSVAALTAASASQTATATDLMRAMRIIIASGSGTLRVAITQQSTQ